MAARNSAFLAYFSLCGGSCFLGVATALGLVYFGQLSDDWRFRVTVGVAGMAVLLLSAGVVLLMREPRADERVRSLGHDPTASLGSTAMDRDGATATTGGSTAATERTAARPPARSSSSQTVGAGNHDAASRSAAEESTHDLAPPERSGYVPGVETSRLDHAESAPTVETEPGPAAELQPAGLIGAWDNYRRTGDGHFNPRGLQRVLDGRGIGASVKDGDRIGSGGSVLIVEAPSRTTHFYVLPSFAKSPRAVADWFDDNSGGALTGRTERVLQIAEGRWTGPGFEVVTRGEVA